MFKKYYIILIISYLNIISSGIVLAQAKEVAAIQQLLKNQQVDWNNGDIEGFMQGYWNADSLVFVGKSGLTWGWEPVLNNYQKNYNSTEKIGKLYFDIFKIKILSKQSAYVIGKWKIDRKDNSTYGYFLLVCQKIKNKWKIVADHTN